MREGAVLGDEGSKDIIILPDQFHNGPIGTQPGPGMLALLVHAGGPYRSVRSRTVPFCPGSG